MYHCDAGTFPLSLHLYYMAEVVATTNLWPRFGPPLSKLTRWYVFLTTIIRSGHWLSTLSHDLLSKDFYTHARDDTRDFEDEPVEGGLWGKLKAVSTETDSIDGG